MAIYHLSVKSLSRGEGRSATAAAAYRAAERIHDQKLGIDYDYTRKRGVEYSEIVLSTSAAKQDVQWARNRQELWNAAEAAEKRKDGRIAREYEIALPSEMNSAQRLQLTRSFAQELADRYNCAVDIAIHAPHRKGDERNHHAHLLATTREITPAGLGDKTAVELSNTDRQRRGLQSASQEMTEIRGRWKELTNQHLQSLGLESRVDHRSLQAQGIQREPTSHLGPVVTERLRRGMDSDVLERIAREREQDASLRLAMAREAGQLERETRGLEQAIVDTETSLQKALASRDGIEAGQERARVVATPETIDEARRQARERWMEYREELALGGNKRENAGDRTQEQDKGHEKGWVITTPQTIDEARRQARERWMEYRAQLALGEDNRENVRERSLDMGMG